MICAQISTLVSSGHYQPISVTNCLPVAMDPHGMGRSYGIECPPRKWSRSPGFPLTDADYQSTSQFNRKIAQNYYDRYGDLVRYVDTISIARDLEAVRNALGDGKLNFVGFSYGSELAATYMELFPR